MQVTRRELWQMQYHDDRYMQGLSEAALRQRFQDILSNLVGLTDGGQLGADVPAEESEFWLPRLTHLREEYRLRDMGLPPSAALGSTARRTIPSPTYPVPPRSASMTQPGSSGSQELFKFGKLHDLQSAVDTGTIWLSPASSFSDPSLNPATRDTELEFTYEIPPARLPTAFVDPLDGTTHHLRGGGPVRYTISANDYYVFCTTAVFAHRLYQDFNADAYVIIHEPERFALDVTVAAASLLPGYAFGYGGVRYIDPLIALPVSMPVQVIKHFRYAYQHEFRCVWQPPPKKQTPLQGILLTIPELPSYAELVRL